MIETDLAVELRRLAVLEDVALVAPFSPERSLALDRATVRVEALLARLASEEHPVAA